MQEADEKGWSNTDAFLVCVRGVAYRARTEGGLGFLTMAEAFKVRLARPTGFQGPGDSEKAS